MAVTREAVSFMHKQVMPKYGDWDKEWQLADIVLRRAMILVARSTGVGVRGGPYAHPLAL